MRRINPKGRKPILTREEILKRLDYLLRKNHKEYKKNIKEENLSEAMICENYFFSLFFLKEDILGEELNIHKERKRLSQKENKE